MNCIICNKKKFDLIWNNFIRSGAKKFTKKKEKIFKCINCNLIFLQKKRIKLENSSITRNLYNKNNSIKEFKKFHTPREIKKIKEIEKIIDLKGKSVLESNCGSGIILDYLKNITKKTYGLDNKLYENYFKTTDHKFFDDINKINFQKKKFDVILSLSEIEHKINPITFLKKLKRMMTKKSRLILRIPNYYNIYYFLIHNDYLKYDYRTSHNYYFSEKNLDLMFNKLNLKTIQKKGLNEYSFNHLLTFLNQKKRVDKNKIKKIFSSNKDQLVVKNINETLTSTSLLYILKLK